MHRGLRASCLRAWVRRKEALLRLRLCELSSFYVVCVAGALLHAALLRLARHGATGRSDAGPGKPCMGKQVTRAYTVVCTLRTQAVQRQENDLRGNKSGVWHCGVQGAHQFRRQKRDLARAKPLSCVGVAVGLMRYV